MTKIGRGVYDKTGIHVKVVGNDAHRKQVRACLERDFYIDRTYDKHTKGAQARYGDTVTVLVLRDKYGKNTQ